MGKSETRDVTMRVRIGDSEVEVTGPSDFVEQKVADFLARHNKPAQKEGLDKFEKPTTASPGTDKKMAVAQFFRKVAVKSDVDRVLAAGYYLERHGGQEAFTTAELATTIRNAKFNPPKNPSDSLAQNIRKGLMMPSGDKEGSRAYVLTSDGEEAIDQRLSS